MTTGDPKREREAADLTDLVRANRILAREKIVDGFGHVSVRSAVRPDTFFLARSMAPALVTADDVMTFDLDGEPLNGDRRRPYLERFIHGEIYRVRPDVMSVVHAHTLSVIPFGVSATRLRPVYHMCGFLGQGAPVFEIRCTAGDDSDMLIRDRVLGAALAEALGDAAVILMRGHGVTVVGPSLRLAVYRAIYSEANARAQAEALRLGEVRYLTPAEAANAAATNDGQVDRCWDLWAASAAGSTEEAGGSRDR